MNTRRGEKSNSSRSDRLNTSTSRNEEDDPIEEAIPFIIYDHETKCKSTNLNILLSIYFK